MLSAPSAQEEGQASGANNAIRELGGVFGVAVLASVFAPEAATLGEAFTDGLTAAVWVGAVLVGIGAVAAFLVPSPARAKDEVPEPALDLAV